LYYFFFIEKKKVVDSGDLVLELEAQRQKERLKLMEAEKRKKEQQQNQNSSPTNQNSSSANTSNNKENKVKRVSILSPTNENQRNNNKNYNNNQNEDTTNTKRAKRKPKLKKLDEITNEKSPESPASNSPITNDRNNEVASSSSKTSVPKARSPKQDPETIIEPLKEDNNKEKETKPKEEPKQQEKQAKKEKEPEAEASPRKDTTKKEEFVPNKVKRQISSFVRIAEKYEFGKVLGDGNFAVVKQARNKQSDHEYAIKIIDKSKMKGKEYMLENEIYIMKSCRHANIVNLYEEYETKDEIYLVTDLIKGGDLFDAISQSVKFSEKDAASMITDLCEALLYLHAKNVKFESYIF
jgi:hypothetical protein